MTGKGRLIRAIEICAIALLVMGGSAADASESLWRAELKSQEKAGDACAPPWRDEIRVEVVVADESRELRWFLVDGWSVTDPRIVDPTPVARLQWSVQDGQAQGRLEVASNAACRLTYGPTQFRRLREDEAKRSMQAVQDAVGSAKLLRDASELAATGQYDDAIRVTSTACMERAGRLGDHHPGTLACRLQDVRRKLEARRAVDVGEELRALRGELSAQLGLGSAFALEALQLEAVRLFFLGRFEESSQAAGNAFRARSLLLGADDPDTLRSLNTYAIALVRVGDRERARPLLATLIDANQRLRGPADPASLSAVFNLATLEFDDGHFSEADRLFTEVWKAREQRLGDGHPLALTSLHSVADARLYRGRASEALALAYPALPKFIAAFGEDHRETLRHLELVARIRVELDQDAQARPQFESVVRASEKVNGPLHPDTLRYRFNLGIACLNLDDRASALKAFEAVARDGPAVLGDDHMHVILARIGVGLALLRSGQVERAIVGLESAERSARKTLPPGHTHRQRASVSLAAARFATGERDTAIQMLETIADERASHNAEWSNDSVELLSTLAQFHLASGNPARAEGLLKEVIDREEARRRSTPLAAEMRRSRLARLADDDEKGAGYKAYVALKIAQGHAPEAFATSELVKGRTLSESLALQALVNRQGGDGKALDDLREASQRLAQIETELSALDPASPRAAALLAERQAGEARVAPLAARASGRPGAKPVVKPLADILRQVIARDAVFVSYVVNHDRITVLVGERSGQVTGLDLGRIEGLRETADAYRRLISSSNPEEERVWRLDRGGYRWSLARPAPDAVRVARGDEVGRFLSDRLLKPIWNKLSAGRRWIVSPDGALALVPFESLPVPIAKGRVVDRHEVTHVQSLGVLAQLASVARVSALPAHQAVLSVAATRFPESPLPGSVERRGWESLPDAEQEADDVAAIWSNRKTLVLKGADASEEALRKMSADGTLASYRWIHLAAHGYLSRSNPLLSAVVLAGSGTRPESDGYVTAAEWPTLRLASELIVVSSCDSASGELLSGEGVFGLPYALMLAGNRRTVLALWPVDDRASAAFMPAFHRRLRRGDAPAKALRETKAQFANSKGPWSAPRHWAPYVLYGD